MALCQHHGAALWQLVDLLHSKEMLVPSSLKLFPFRNSHISLRGLSLGVSAVGPDLYRFIYGMFLCF